ncbi:Histone-lysine N-methyltransferase SETMAR [Eumeta japonica]|uniref:Histone-lysine N-methyltransferase SETMAR n=1 Tax=Eumeta variegata TaxID=151549 RepID=A0A4C1WCU6_EUMVA|nr:Histone-lysine N-methyltransferase SETMAR [Eumeta japonica]
MLTDEFKEGRPKSVVVPQNIDAVRELMMQDRHVTYREIKASLGISMTSIHKVLHDNLAAKNICWRWTPHNLSINEKQVRVDWCKEMKRKYNQEVFKEIRKNDRQHRIILHHDNASCHTSAATTRLLQGQKIEWTGHPPYSLDLAPKYLFPMVKNKLPGQSFMIREEDIDAFKMQISEIPQSERKKCYKNWFQRMQKCIDHHGEYFEKQ